MNNFDFLMKTKIIFGEGEAYNLSKWINQDHQRALIVTGKTSAIRFGYLDTISEQLKQLNIEIYLYNKISPNPRIEEIDEAVEYAKNNDIDLVIGLGGGSALDAAKAIAAMFYLDGNTEEVLTNRKSLTDKRLALIQLPTTAGTGSELSKGSILSDRDRGIKAGIRGDVLLADIAIVDPMLTYSLPFNLTMETGFDIFTHAIETFLSLKSSPMTEIFSVEAIKRVFVYLPRLAKSLDDAEARRELSYSSMLMGINLANSSTCLPHRLQYPIGATTDTSHSKGLAAIYPSWLELSMIYNRVKFSQLAKLLGYHHENENIALEKFYQVILQFLHEIGMNVSLTSLGIDKSMLPILEEKTSGSLANDPISRVENIIETIYLKSI